MKKEEIGKEIIWNRSWIRRRDERGVYHQLIRELALEDEPTFARYFRMDKFSDGLLQQAPPSCLFTSHRRDLFPVLFGAFWDDVALKVSGGGFTRTNTNKIRATMLQVFESLSKTCNMLPQQNVALKMAMCTMLHEETLNATMLR